MLSTYPQGVLSAMPPSLPFFFLACCSSATAAHALHFAAHALHFSCWPLPALHFSCWPLPARLDK